MKTSKGTFKQRKNRSDGLKPPTEKDDQYTRFYLGRKPQPVGKDSLVFNVEHIRETNPEQFNQPQTFPTYMDEWTKWYSQVGVFGEEKEFIDTEEEEFEIHSHNNPFEKIHFTDNSWEKLLKSVTE